MEFAVCLVLHPILKPGASSMNPYSNEADTSTVCCSPTPNFPARLDKEYEYLEDVGKTAAWCTGVDASCSLGSLSLVRTAAEAHVCDEQPRRGRLQKEAAQLATLGVSVHTYE